MANPGLISEALPAAIPGASAGSAARPTKAALPKNLLISLASTAVILSLWAVLTNAGVVGPGTMPTPQALVVTFWTFVVHGYDQVPAWQNVLISVFRAMSGLGIGLVCGIPVGLLMGYSPVFSAILKPVFSFLRPIPALAFIPLVVLFFGIGQEAKIAVIAEAAFLYSVLHSSAGAAAVPENYILLARNLGLSRLEIFRRVVLPAAAPYIVAGVRTATAISWAVVVAAELIASHRGLGFMIMDAATFYRIPYVYLGIILIGVIGVLLESTISAAEREIIHWKGKD